MNLKKEAGYKRAVGMQAASDRQYPGADGCR